MKIFTYEENGLSYTVTVYEENGQVFADITVNSGFMDVNAVYIADDDFSGSSASLGGPLNMNGGGSNFEGETVQWDDAIELSRPGLGREGTGKSTFLQQGESMTVSLDNVSSIDDVDFFGVRATSTSTPEGSIKGVSGDPTEEDDDDDDGDAIYSKVFFVYDSEADSLGGFPFTTADLPTDAEGTFADYVALFEDADFADLSDINTVIFYTGDDLEEVFRLEGPFEDTEALLAAYDEAIQAADVSDLMVAFVSDDDAAADDEPEAEDELAII